MVKQDSNTELRALCKKLLTIRHLRHTSAIPVPLYTKKKKEILARIKELV